MKKAEGKRASYPSAFILLPSALPLLSVEQRRRPGPVGVEDGGGAGLEGQARVGRPLRRGQHPGPGGGKKGLSTPGGQRGGGKNAPGGEGGGGGAGGGGETPAGGPPPPRKDTPR